VKGGRKSGAVNEGRKGPTPCYTQSSLLSCFGRKTGFKRCTNRTHCYGLTKGPANAHKLHQKGDPLLQPNARSLARERRPQEKPLASLKSETEPLYWQQRSRDGLLGSVKQSQLLHIIAGTLHRSEVALGIFCASKERSNRQGSKSTLIWTSLRTLNHREETKDFRHPPTHHDHRMVAQLTASHCYLKLPRID
jgi:hypothetical protein